MGILQYRQASHRGSGPEAGSTVEVITYPVCEFFLFAPLGALGRSLAIIFSPLEWRHQPQRCEILQSVVLGTTAQDCSISEIPLATVSGLGTEVARVRPRQRFGCDIWEKQGNSKSVFIRGNNLICGGCYPASGLLDL